MQMKPEEVRKIYLDMDGVLADFRRGVWEMCGMKPCRQNDEQDREKDEEMWKRIREADHFYDRLELKYGAKKMFDTIRGAFGDRCEILTAVPKPGRGIADAGEDKIRWVRRMLSEDVKVHIVLREEKADYCTGPETVLIDDSEVTIREWQKRGGTGILYYDSSDALISLGYYGLLPYNYYQDYGPMQPVIYRRGNKMTEAALELGFITEADVED